jgi:hypothetical protein
MRLAEIVPEVTDRVIVPTGTLESHGLALMPAWATMRLPAEGMGYINFDVHQAQQYTQKKADLIASTFLEAVKRWEMMEKWK